MVAEQQLCYAGPHDPHMQQQYPRNIQSRSPPPAMMLAESKFFPGHPATLHQPAPPYGPPGFPRKDLFTQRKQREFIPENKKDDSYWDRRRRNNEAAKRSREKRRLNDMLLETRVIELTKDNHILKAQLNAIYEKYGIKGESMISMDQVLSTLPSNDQVLNFTKKRLGGMSLSPGSPAPTPIPFPSLGLPISINNNNSSSVANNNTTAPGTPRPRSCSPDRASPARSCRSASPPPFHAGPPMMPRPHYPDMRAYHQDNAHMYRRPPSRQRYDEDQQDKDSGLALNLSADRAGSDGTRDESGRSSASGSPPVTSSNILERDGSSSGDESGYPRSPNSGGSSSDNPTNLPHKLRFKTVVGEKEAVSSLLSLHQMAMIKREPVEHINQWMETAAAGTGLPHPGFLASLLPPREHFKQINKDEEEEPAKKRLKIPEMIPDNLKDEVARLTSEVATLKNILVNRMKETEEDSRHEELDE